MKMSTAACDSEGCDERVRVGDTQIIIIGVCRRAVKERANKMYLKKPKPQLWLWAAGL